MRWRPRSSRLYTLQAALTTSSSVLRHFTATSCIGRGLQATLESLRAQRSGLTPCAFETVTLDTHIGEVPGVDEVRLPSALQRFDCRNNRLAQLGLPRTASRCGRGLCRRAGVAAHGRVSRHQHLGHPQTELAYRHRDPASGALPPTSTTPRTHNSILGRRFRAPPFGLRRAGGGGLHGLLLERQSFRLGAAHDRRRPHRCGHRRWRRLAVPDHAVRLPLAAADLARALPAVRCRPRRHLDRRGRGLRAARARAGGACR